MWQNLFHSQTHNRPLWLILSREVTFSLSTLWLTHQNQDLLFVDNPFGCVWMFIVCNAVPGIEIFALYETLTLADRLARQLLSTPIQPLILYLYSIVLLWFHATIVLPHSSLLRLNLSLMIGIAFLGYLSDNLADLPTAHCRLNTLSVVIPHLWVLSFTQRSLIPRIFSTRLKPLVATFHTYTCRHF